METAKSPLQDSIQDFAIKVFRSGRAERQKILRYGVSAVAALACVWLGYFWYVKPTVAEHRLERALAALTPPSVLGLGRTPVDGLKDLPPQKMYIAAFELLTLPPINPYDQTGLSGARAALDLAINEGSNEARLLLGKAFRDGTFGEKDSAAALRQFEKARLDLEAGVKAGEATALYAYALMLSEGLGIAIDKTAAIAMMIRASDGLEGWRLNDLGMDAARGLGAFKNAENSELANRIARRLMAARDYSAYKIFLSSCYHTSGLAALIPDSPTGTLPSLSDALDRSLDCSEPLEREAATARYKPAMADYASTLLSRYGKVELASQWYEAAGSGRTDADNYSFGALKATTATDIEELVIATRMMWVARQREKMSESPTSSFHFGRLSLLTSNLQKALAPNQGLSGSNYVTALLALAELENNTADTLQTLQASIGGPYLISLTKSSRIREAAPLVAKAIGANKTYAQIQSGQVAKK